MTPSVITVAPIVKSVVASTVVPVIAAGVTLPIIPWKLVPDATPSTGVVKVGDVANTANPEPVSSDNAVLSCKEVKDPSTAAFPVEVT
jgi:hypothetical protein